MRTSVIYYGLVALASATFIGLTSVPASAQLPRINPGFNAFQPAINSTAFGNPNFRINPNLTLAQGAFNTAVMGQAFRQIPPFALGFNPFVSPLSVGSLSTSPFGAGLGAGYGTGYDASLSSGGYGGYNPYMPYYDPYGAALMGSADIINSQGRFAVSIEQSRITHEQVRQARIETRRKLFDEYKYERDNTPTAQELREKDQVTLYRRSITNPPVTEVLSGDSLNTLLDHLTKMQASGARGPSVPLDEATLKQVNVRPEGRTGNIGLLKYEGNLKWPQPLQAPEYDKERKRLEEFLPKAVQQASFQGVDPGTLSAIREDLEKLQERFSANVNDLGTGKYIEGKRFLNSLDEAVAALGQPDVTNYFNHKFEAKGKTVAELVNYLREKGLRFAPAVSGEEAAYRALLQAMVAYDASLTQVATKDAGDSSKAKD
jgi:hypothetical protein